MLFTNDRTINMIKIYGYKNANYNDVKQRDKNCKILYLGRQSPQYNLLRDLILYMSRELLDHLPFCREQDIVFTKLPGGESNTVRKMCPRETGGYREERRIGGWAKGDKEVLRGSTVTRAAPSPLSKLHSRQAVSDYPHVEARIRLDRRNFAISLFSRARIEKFKVSPHDGRTPNVSRHRIISRVNYSTVRQSRVHSWASR